MIKPILQKGKEQTREGKWLTQDHPDHGFGSRVCIFIGPYERSEMDGWIRMSLINGPWSDWVFISLPLFFAKLLYLWPLPCWPRWFLRLSYPLPLFPKAKMINAALSSFVNSPSPFLPPSPSNCLVNNNISCSVSDAYQLCVIIYGEIDRWFPVRTIFSGSLTSHLASLSPPPSSNNTTHFRSWGLDLLGNLFLLHGLGLSVINIIEWWKCKL